MAVVAYKCPNCGAPLEFSPESQKFECSFCGSSFTEEELQSIAPAQCSEQTISQASTESEGEEGALSLYLSELRGTNRNDGDNCSNQLSVLP